MDLRTRGSRILLTLTVHADDRECVLAHLEEEFESRRTSHGDSAAQRWYRDASSGSLMYRMEPWRARRSQSS